MLRDIIYERLETDLIGPDKENEILDSLPTDVYLTGILWPAKTKAGGESDEQLAVGSSAGDSGGNNESNAGETPRNRMNQPASAGISFALESKSDNPVIHVKVSFAVYIPEEVPDERKKSAEDSEKPEWHRKPYLIDIPDFSVKPGTYRVNLEKYEVPEGVYIHTRTILWKNRFLVTLTLVNEQNPGERPDKNIVAEKSLYQVKIVIYGTSDTELTERPSIGPDNVCQREDDEELSAAMLFRNVREFATGHNCSAEWKEAESETNAEYIRTKWLPYSVVFSTSPEGHEVFRDLGKDGPGDLLSADWLSMADDATLSDNLTKLPDAYRKWIDIQYQKINQLPDKFLRSGQDNLKICCLAESRIRDGIERIGSSPVLAESFRLANRAIQIQYSWNKKEDAPEHFRWRPFQLAFILLSLTSVTDRNHPDRTVMDLLWFPTGGGKTEAYLGLIAALAFYRRLSHPKNPDEGAGVCTVMRYTLRLLTTQQFTRACSLICACELIRRENNRLGQNNSLGKIPFSIGLWVGGEATPNDYKTVEKALNGNETRAVSPEQISYCPACKEDLEWYSDSRLKEVRVRCQNTEDCILAKTGQDLPIYTVDTDIYRLRPTLLIGTIDKFAQIVRNKGTHDLFSLDKGYPPDLILQDELHLISGPLGTIAGLYETIMDRIFECEGKGPKIIGSTATIRRAPEQVKALFNRSTFQFPPSGLDADDSGFAVKDLSHPGRLYVGVTSAGRSAKFTLQAVSASLLQSALGASQDRDERDPYWTLVSYFNSLRELGGALVLVQDDVNATIEQYANRRKEEARKPEQGRIKELTSGRTQDEVREILNELEDTDENYVLDVVLATNMLSVGVDIPRLGLMLVNGQPKAISEYIQSTSRVGRGNVPGLIISVLNNAKPRDRSHYESFPTWHQTLYKDVEAASVTPFASRARDKALPAVLTGLIRHTVPGMLDSPYVSPGSLDQGKVDEIINYISDRARQLDPDEILVLDELQEYWEDWKFRNPKLYYPRKGEKRSLLQSAETAATLRAVGCYEGESWPVMNNMRSVEPETSVILIKPIKKNLRRYR